MNKWFTRFSGQVAQITGSSWAFLAAVALIVVWLVTGPLFGFSDTWQLVINTGTTIVTFLMVFLIQNTQNRDAKALHLKLDEIIHVISKARNELIEVEDLTDEDLRQLVEIYRKLARGEQGKLTERELQKKLAEAAARLRAEEDGKAAKADKADETPAPAAAVAAKS